MGEYADYILNGDDCESCGEYLGEGDGFPRQCPSCSGEDSEDTHPFDEVEADIEVIGQALKEYKKIAWKALKCKKDKCKKTAKGIVHQKNCNANKHRKLAKEAWKIFQDNYS